MSHKSGSRTQQAHIVTCCGFDVIDHPVMEWMKDFAHAFDKGTLKASGPSAQPQWHTSDFTFVGPSGESVSGIGPAWEKLMQVYAPMSSQYHEPHYGIVFETPEGDGYELFGMATMYYNLHAPPQGVGIQLQGPTGSFPPGGPGGPGGGPTTPSAGRKARKVADLSEGNTWEHASPAANRFTYRRDADGHKGLKLCRQVVHTDTFPLKAELVKRGVVTLEQLSPS